MTIEWLYNYIIIYRPYYNLLNMKSGIGLEIRRISFKNKNNILTKYYSCNPTDFDSKLLYIGYKFKIIIFVTEIGCLFKIKNKF